MTIDLLYAPNDPPHPGACRCHPLPSKKQISLSLRSTRLLGGFLVSMVKCYSFSVDPGAFLFCKPVSDYAVAWHCIKESTYNQIIDDNLHEYVEIMILIYIYIYIIHMT